MLKAVIGHAQDFDPLKAVQSAIESCREQLQGEQPDVGIFLTSRMDADFAVLLGEIKGAFPDMGLIGCTTDGEVSSVEDFADESMALLLLRSDTIQFGVGLGRDFSKNPEAAAAAACAQARESLDAEPAMAIVFPDGLTTIDMHIDDILQKALGAHVPIFGGAAGDHFMLEQTWQFFDNEVVHDAMPLLLMSGSFHYSSALKNGWKPIGKRYPATVREPNTITHIGSMTALDFYQHYLGESDEYLQFPLALYTDESDHFVLRDPIKPNDDRSIHFLGAIPQKASVQLTEVGREDIIEAAAAASKRAFDAYPGREPQLGIIFTCATRRQILGTKTREESRAFRQACKKPIPFFGFYTYGEFGPFFRNGPTHRHNEAFNVLLLGD